MKPVFMSASEPYRPGDREYLQTGNIANVREAVRALCAHVLPAGTLVFGGHPAIAPLVRGIAEAMDASSHVIMFQSKAYVAETTASDTVLTEAHDRNGAAVAPSSGWRNMSLLRMRYEMLGGPSPGGGEVFPLLLAFAGQFGTGRYQRLGTFEFAAGFFIGGMEGVEKEFRIFRSFHPTTPAYPLASTGSAAKHLRESELAGPEHLVRLLDGETAYSLLMEQLLPLPEPGKRPLFGQPEGIRWRHEGTASPETHLDPDSLDRPIAPSVSGNQPPTG